MCVDHTTDMEAHVSYLINHRHVDKSTRVPCPVNSNHSVVLSKLAGHVSKCPDRQYNPKFNGHPGYVRKVNYNWPTMTPTPQASLSKSTTEEENGVGTTDGEFKPLMELIEKEHLVHFRDLLDRRPPSEPPLLDTFIRWMESIVLEEVARLDTTIEQQQQQVGGKSDQKTPGPLQAAQWTRFSLMSALQKVEEGGGENTTTCPFSPSDRLHPQLEAYSLTTAATTTLAPAPSGTETSSTNTATTEGGNYESHKHRLQEACLVQIMDEVIGGGGVGHSSSNCSFLELGAGKAGLSVAVRQLFHDTSKNPIFVVDRSNFKDSNEKKPQYVGSVQERIRMLVEDFAFDRYPTPAPPPQGNTEGGGAIEDDVDRGWVLVGKHLCGSCTDFSLTCALNALNKSPPCRRVQAIVLAPCCRHLCDYEPFVRDSLSIRLVPSRCVWDILRSLTSWASGGKDASPWKIRAGTLAKRILDLCRLRGMKEALQQQQKQLDGSSGDSHVPNCFALRTYISSAVTPENVALVIWRGD